MFRNEDDYEVPRFARDDNRRARFSRVDLKRPSPILRECQGRADKNCWTITLRDYCSAGVARACCRRQFQAAPLSVK